MHHRSVGVAVSFVPSQQSMAGDPLALIPPIEALSIEDKEEESSRSVAFSAAASDPLSGSTYFTSPSDLCIELDSLHDLASRGQWRSVLDKVARARSLSLLTHPHHHLVYLAFNLLALYKLRRYPDAAQELHQLTLEDDLGLDSPRFRYESYPDTYPGRSGSMLPFAVRYVHAELPQRLGDRPETVDRLYSLLDLARSKVSQGSSEQWKRRETFIISALCCNHFYHKEYDACLLLIQELLQRDSSDPFVLSRLGYIQMQMGDLNGCKATFAHVEGLRKEDGNDVVFQNLVSRNKALEFVLSKDYLSAVREYDECIGRDPTDAVAINNKALCLMYSRDLSDAIKVLEGALERVPTSALNELLVVNLCSMYELAYVNNGEVKRDLNTWIARVAPDDFDASCTRM